MEPRVTRRIVLGTLIGALVAGPFVMRALRPPKTLPMGEDSPLGQFRAKYREALAIPREYNPLPNKQLAEQPKEVIDKVLAIHRKRWESLSRIDEAEFDYSSHAFEKDGTVKKGNFYMDAHVQLKYGYGMIVKGKNVSGEPIDWVFNLDGDVTTSAMKQMNLSSMMLSFFGAVSALSNSTTVRNIHAENVDLPDNPYTKGNGKYDVLEGYKGELEFMAPRIAANTYTHAWYSRETGMPEFIVGRHTQYASHKKYFDENEPVPVFRKSYVVNRFVPVDGIVLLASRDAYYPIDEPDEASGSRASICARETYNNVKVKLL